MGAGATLSCASACHRKLFAGAGDMNCCVTGYLTNCMLDNGIGFIALVRDRGNVPCLPIRQSWISDWRPQRERERERESSHFGSSREWFEPPARAERDKHRRGRKPGRLRALRESRAIHLNVILEKLRDFIAKALNRQVCEFAPPGQVRADQGGHCQTSVSTRSATLQDFVLHRGILHLLYGS